MSAPNIILDGVLPYGTTPITVTGVIYKVNSETITPTWTEAEDADSNGSPRGGRKRWTRGRYSYTGNWQLATGSTAYPVPGVTFTRSIPNEDNPITFVVLQVPFEATNEASAIRTINMTAEEVVIGITTA